MMTERQKFYRSDRWHKFRNVIISERQDADGYVHCAKCGKEILKRYDMVLHHIKELTDDNVADAEIALNPDNVEIVCFKCHNIEHERFGFQKGGTFFRKTAQEVVIVHGSPGAGKTTWVRENARDGDLILDLDKIWAAVNAKGDGAKPNSLKPVVFGLRDKLYDMIEHRLGEWNTAFVIGTLPRIGDRERLAQRLGADRTLHIDTDRRTCLERIAMRHGSKEEVEEWSEYVDKYWENFQPDDTGGD